MKKIIFILVTILTVMSCGSSSLVNKTKRLELGMTKKKVISVMGKDFKVTSASKTSDGNLEIISYSNSISDNESTYIICFMNGKLEKWHEERKNTHRPSTARKNKHSR